MVTKCVKMLSLKIFLICCMAFAHTSQEESAIDQLEQYIEEKRLGMNHRYRPQYHVAGPVGWINDPNGFSFYKGQYHLFFQFYPYDIAWGPMHWGHVVSPDLVNWQRLPTALIPEEEQCFSGSAVVVGDNLFLMYTGHVIGADQSVNQSQYLATSSDGVTFKKYEGNPIITSPNGSPDFRDPKAWRHGDHWYVIIGSKTDNGRGRVLLYRSPDMFEWEFLSVIKESNGEDLGYMMECPDFFELDGKFVLLMSPQGIEPKGDRFKNLHQTGYILGSFNYTTFVFTPETEFQELDYGHDIYAAQTTENNGKRYAIYWFNMWENHFPEAVDGWCGALTIVRELRVHRDRLLMKPVEQMVTLRKEQLFNNSLNLMESIVTDVTTVEILISGDVTQDMQFLVQGRNGGLPVYMRWSVTSRKLALVKGSDERQVEWQPVGSTSWRVFLDASTLEWFCGEGEAVFSSRVFPDGGWKVTNIGPQPLHVQAYTLGRSVPL